MKTDDFITMAGAIYGQPQVSVNKQQEVKKQKHIGQTLLRPGHTMWQINIKTGEITKAEFSDTRVDIITGKRKRKIIVQPDCIYRAALNIKNVKRKLKMK